MRLLLFLLCAVALAQQPEPLWPNGNEDTAITAYIAKLPVNKSVVICPGGGYQHLAMDHEGAQVAQWLNSLGISAFVLKYRLGPVHHHPEMLQDAQQAIRVARARRPNDRVGIMGFSAGGHLASTAATHFTADTRPDFLILAYPVISMNSEYTHAGSRKNLLGDNPDPKLLDDLSNDQRVTSQTPPTFLFHTTDDATVPVENSIRFYLALRKAGVPAELHVYAHGRHGVGLAPTDAALSSWPARLADWLRNL